MINFNTIIITIILTLIAVAILIWVYRERVAKFLMMGILGFQINRYGDRIKIKEIQKVKPSIKYVIAGVIDFIDFILPPGLETIFDLVIALPAALILWGWWGLIAAWEVLEFSSVVDRFVPTVVLAGIISERMKRK